MILKTLLPISISLLTISTPRFLLHLNRLLLQKIPLTIRHSKPIYQRSWIINIKICVHVTDCTVPFFYKFPFLQRVLFFTVQLHRTPLYNSLFHICSFLVSPLSLNISHISPPTHTLLKRQSNNGIVLHGLFSTDCSPHPHS